MAGGSKWTVFWGEEDEASPKERARGGLPVMFYTHRTDAAVDVYGAVLE